VRPERSRDAVRLEIGDGDPLHLPLLQQIKGAGGPLQARAQNQHAHDELPPDLVRDAAAES
jgi:hypothetical protein